MQAEAVEEPPKLADVSVTESKATDDDDKKESREGNSDGDKSEKDDLLEKYDPQLKKSADIKSLEEAVEESKQRALILAEIANSNSNFDDGDRLRYAMSSFVFGRIAKSMVLWVRSWRKAVIEEFLNSGFMNMFYKAISTCDYISYPGYADQLHLALIQISDCSYKASKYFCDKGIIPVLVNMLNDDRFKANLSDKGYQRLVNRVVGSMHNLAKVKEYKEDFHNHNAEEVLKFYLVDGNVPAKAQISALCATSFILPDKDASLYSDECDVIPKLMSCLSKAVDKPEKMRKAYSGFSAEELVGAISNLALNDENKTKLVDNGILPVLAKMLTFNLLEKEQAVSCLWRLAFSDSVRHKILEMPELLKNLETISASSEANEEHLKTKSARALEFIRLGKDGIGSASSSDKKDSNQQPPSGSHIFLSYSWKQQDIVLKIKDALVEKGYKVWIDVDQMHGSTLESMARAVENASVVMICYSEHYRTSNMCRTEAEYTFRLQKPFVPLNLQYRYAPDGWLGIIIGARLYVDFSLFKHPYEIVLPRLFSELTQIERGITEVSEHTAVALEKPKQTQQLSSGDAVLNSQGHHCQSCKDLQAKVDRCCQLVEELSAHILLKPKLADKATTNLNKSKQVRCWTSSDVSTWLCNAGIPDGVVQSFSTFDGKSVAGLYDMKNTAPDMYFRTVLQLCSGSFPTCIGLTIELEHLFNN